MEWRQIMTPIGVPGMVVGRFRDGGLLVAIPREALEAAGERCLGPVKHVRVGWCELHQAAFAAEGRCAACGEGSRKDAKDAKKKPSNHG